MEENKKIQWHNAFYSAMELELREYKQVLQYHRELGLNTKPINVDMLIIKKLRNAILDKKICEIFQGHNLIEYKSPKDGINVDSFSKTMAYAFLYKSMGKSVNERKTGDITISIIQQRTPRALFQYLRENGYTIQQRHKGIYDICGNIPFVTQIVVTQEIDREEYEWITKLTDHLTRMDAYNLVQNCSKLYDKDDAENASSVFNVAYHSNRQMFYDLRRFENMYEALDELFKDRIDEWNAEKTQWNQKETQWNQKETQWNQKEVLYQSQIAQLQAELEKYKKEN